MSLVSPRAAGWGLVCAPMPSLAGGSGSCAGGGADLLEASHYRRDYYENQNHHAKRDDFFFWPFHIPEKPQTKLLYFIH